MRAVVLDTNVIVSALLSPSGKCSKILDLMFKSELQIYISHDILIEYKDVLSRPELDLNIKKKKIFFEVIEKIGILIEPAISTISLPDESDRIFYDTAKESGAILVTGNIKHFPEEDFIINPSEFLDEFNSND